MFNWGLGLGFRVSGELGSVLLIGVLYSAIPTI